MSSTGPDSVLEAAEQHSEAGDHADAAHLLAEALITGPPDAALLRALAAAQFEVGWDGPALALLAEAQRIAPDDVAVGLEHHHRLREHGRHSDALAAPGTSVPRLRAVTLHELGLPLLAVDAAGGPRGRSRWEWVLWLRCGGPLTRLRARARRREQAALSSHTLVHPPAGAVPPLDLPAAVAHVEAGTAHDRDALAAVRIALAHCEQDRAPQAAAVLAAALREDPTHPLLLRHAAAVADRLERLPTALSLYQRLAVNPSPVDTLVQQIDLLRRMLRFPEALRLAADGAAESRPVVDAPFGPIGDVPFGPVGDAPLGPARTGEVRAAVARVYADAGLPGLAIEAYGPAAALPLRWRSHRRGLWWRTGWPLPPLRRRRLRRETGVTAAWRPVPLAGLLPSVSTVDPATLMDRAAHAGAVLAHAAQVMRAEGRGAAVAALAGQGGDPQLVKELGLLHHLDHRDETALTHFAAARAADPGDLRLLDRHAAALIRLGRHREAADLLDTAPAPARDGHRLRAQRSWWSESAGLRVLAFDALGPWATVPSRQRPRWWRWWLHSGGPLETVRATMRRCEQSVVREWRSSARPALRLLDTLVPPGTDASARIRALVDRHLLAQAALPVRWERRTVVARVTAGAAAAAGVAIGVAVVARDHTALPGPAAALTGLVAAGVAYAVPAERTAARSRAAVLAVFAAVVYQLRGHTAGWPAVFGAALAGVAVVTAARLVTAVAVRAFAAAAVHRLRRAEPRTTALVEILALLGELQDPGKRGELRWRRCWLERLERIAHALERDLPAAFGPVDRHTHRQFTEGGRGAAAAVRQLKYLIAAPATAGVWQRVEEVLRHDAGALATGEFGRLRRASPAAVPAPDRRIRRIRRAVAVFTLGQELAAVARSRDSGRPPGP